MALELENINNLIYDDLERRNRNWAAIDALKADKTYVDTQDALKADKTYVDSKVQTDVPAGAKFTDTVYSHPATHSADMITDGTTNKAYTSAEKTKLSGISTNANNYSHPTGDGSEHVPANGTTNNGKVLKAGATAGTYIWSNDNDTITTINGKTGTITKEDITALGIPSQDTVVDISGKADITYVDSQDALKADLADLALKADKSYVDSLYANGIPAGGTAGQVLSKVDATDYNAQWVNASSGVGIEVYAIFAGGETSSSRTESAFGQYFTPLTDMTIEGGYFATDWTNEVVFTAKLYTSEGTLLTSGTVTGDGSTKTQKLITFTTPQSVSKLASYCIVLEIPSGSIQKYYDPAYPQAFVLLTQSFSGTISAQNETTERYAAGIKFTLG